jgi:AAA+ ATPase superfamily predicted ATPase
MIELLYQNWYFHRPELAKRILDLLLEGPGDPLALVGDRRIGKTSHLLFELVPLAQKRGLIPVYIDVFQHRSDPLAAINYALQEAIDDIAVPRSQTGKRLKTAVKKFGVGSVSLELGEEPARRRPDDPFLLVDWLLKTLVRAAKRPVLLIFDEVQELATAADGENVVSAIRSAITKSKNSVRVVFTGSSQQKLLELFSRSRAALYEGASTMPFPHLGAAFIDFVARHCRERFKKRVAAGDLSAAFARLHHQPRALIDLVLVFASRSEDNLSATLDDQIRAQLTGAEYGTLWSAMRQLQQRICLRIVRGEDVTSLAARREYAQGSKRNEVPPGTVSDALRAMVMSHVLSKSTSERGDYRIDDPLFAEWLMQERERLPSRQ